MPFEHTGDLRIVERVFGSFAGCCIDVAVNEQQDVEALVGYPRTTLIISAYFLVAPAGPSHSHVVVCLPVHGHEIFPFHRNVALGQSGAGWKWTSILWEKILVLGIAMRAPEVARIKRLSASVCVFM